MRTDGEHTIYQVKWLYPGKSADDFDGWISAEGSEKSANVPKELRGGYYGTREDGTHGFVDFKEPLVSLTACGECWQKTSIHGTFDRKRAEECMVLLGEHNPDTQFAVMELQVSQRRRIVSTRQP
jgi:hypothetical protein